MKFDSFVLNKRVLLLDGRQAQVPNFDGTVLVDLLVREAFRRALNGTYADEVSQQTQAGVTPGLPFEKKMERYNIAVKLLRDEAVELKPEELSELRKCISKMYVGEVLGYLSTVIDGNEPFVSGMKATNGTADSKLVSAKPIKK